MKLHVIRLLISLLIGAGLTTPTLAQLASEPIDPESLMNGYLLTAEELSTSHCVRFKGATSKTPKHGDPPTIMDVFGVSAVSIDPKGTYHCWGSESLTSTSSRPRGFRCLETLWDGEQTFRKLSLEHEPTAGTLVELDDEGQPKIRPMNPQIDFAGLVFCSEGGIMAKYSSISGYQEYFSSATLLESKRTQQGDVIGTWRDFKNKGVTVVQFGRDVEYRPVIVETYLWDAESNAMGKRVSRTETKWKRQGDTLLPSRITINTVRSTGDRVEIDLWPEWLEPDVWAKAHIDFKQLAQQGPSIWHSRFISLFEDPNWLTR